MAIDREGQTVEAVQTIFGRHPHETTGILVNGIHQATRQTIVRREVFTGLGRHLDTQSAQHHEHAGSIKKVHYCFHPTSVFSSNDLKIPIV
jgi:hypothetical protein